MNEPRSSPEGIFVSYGELTLLLVQSLLLGATMAFTCGVILARMVGLPSAAATSLGLFAGLLASYQTIVLYARAAGGEMRFIKWLAICFVNALFVMLLLSVF